MIDVSRLAKELAEGRLAKQPRVVSHWQPNDKAYAGDVPKYSKMPYNFHLPILAGFEDTLIAKIDESPLVKFGGNQPGEIRLGRQYESVWKAESDKAEGNYAMADLAAKRHAARYGRAFLKVVGTKKPFRIDVLAVDPYDMITDPAGGPDLEDHAFVIQDGIFRTKKQLLDGVKSGMYDKEAVAKVLAGPDASHQAYVTENDLSVRYASLKADGYGYWASGTKVYRLCEHVTYDEDGEKHLVTWSPESKIILKDGTLAERYGCEYLPWVSWAPFEDSKVFWSKAPDDDIRQAAEAVRVTVMEMLTNVQKKNWGTKVFDPSRISAEDLAFAAPNGLVPAKSGTADMPGGLDAAFKIIETPDVNIALNVINFLDRFVGQKSGVTPDTQGTSTEDKVGIYFGNLEQLADRMGLQSRYYKAAWRRVAVRFLYQLKRNLVGKMPVQVIGAKGNEMTYLMARNVEPTIGINIMGGSAEAAVSEAKRKERGAAVDSLIMNPAVAQSINLEAAATEKLRSAGFEDDEVRLLMNKDAGSEYRDQQLRAQEAVEEILEGDKPPLYYGATTVFVQSILDAAQAFTDGDGPEHERLIAYANAHIKVAAKNMANKAAQEAMVASIQPGQAEEITEPQEPPGMAEPMEEPQMAPQEQITSNQNMV